jgi:octaprenyl-diphosphate synthase
MLQPDSNMSCQANASSQRLGELYAPIAEDLAQSEKLFEQELASDVEFIGQLCRHIREYRGKRLRPALLLLSGQACGQVRREHHVLAAVVEMIHLATLVHDDILDESELRRSRATIHRRWGNEAAVLIGDYLISHAFHLCSSLGEVQAARLIGSTTNTVCEGELMQVANRGNFKLSEAQYLEIISRKTASLIGACCLLGAIYADAGEHQASLVERFGQSLGTAFQIIDDVLDIAGSEQTVGKSLGRDLALGKLTLPGIHYLRTASAEQRQAFMQLLTEGNPRRIAQLLEASQSLAYARQVARRYVEQAQAALAELPATPARESLVALAEFALTREQ